VSLAKNESPLKKEIKMDRRYYSFLTPCIGARLCCVSRPGTREVTRLAGVDLHRRCTEGQELQSLRWSASIMLEYGIFSCRTRRKRLQEHWLTPKEECNDHPLNYFQRNEHLHPQFKFILQLLSDLYFSMRDYTVRQWQNRNF